MVERQSFPRWLQGRVADDRDEVRLMSQCRGTEHTCDFAPEALLEPAGVATEGPGQCGRHPDLSRAGHAVHSRRWGRPWCDLPELYDVHPLSLPRVVDETLQRRRLFGRGLGGLAPCGSVLPVREAGDRS